MLVFVVSLLMVLLLEFLVKRIYSRLKLRESFFYVRIKIDELSVEFF